MFVVVASLVGVSCDSRAAGWRAPTPRDVGEIERSSAGAAAASADRTTTQVQQPSAGNPVLDIDFPDPYVLAVDDGYRAFGTNSRGLNVPTAASDDLATWTQAGDALPDLPSWVMPGSVWAPSMERVGAATVLYVTVGDLRRGRQCIYAATSEAVDLPSTLRDEPLVCAAGGSIDASPWTDADGAQWLVWKDEPTKATPAQIRSAPLTSDGLRLAAAPVTLLSSSDVPGHPNVEAPSLVRSSNGSVLFFSVGDWTTGDYRTGYATCSTPSGPCEVRSTEWLTTAASGTGPGGLEAFRSVDGHAYIAFHTWSGSRRVLSVDRLEFGTDDTPLIAPRTTGAAK